MQTLVHEIKSNIVSTPIICISSDFELCQKCKKEEEFNKEKHRLKVCIQKKIGLTRAMSYT
jgi:hypothetical protein